MKYAAALALGAFFVAAPLAAQAQQSQEPGRHSQERGQQSQIDESRSALPQQEQAQQERQLKEARLEGKVKDVDKDKVELEVAGNKVSLEADRQELEGIQKGDIVQVTAVPLPEAHKVKQVQQASQEERQKVQSNEDPKFISGEIQEINNKVATVKTEQGETLSVRVKEHTAKTLQPGGQYIFELSSAPGDSDKWMAQSISKM